MTEFGNGSSSHSATTQQIMVNTQAGQPTFLINGPNGKFQVVPASSAGSPVQQATQTVLIANGNNDQGTVLYQPVMDQSAANGGSSNVFSAALLQQLIQQSNQQNQATIGVPSQNGGNIVMVLNQGGTTTPIQIGQSISSQAPIQIQGNVVTHAGAQANPLAAATQAITSTDVEEEPLYVNAKQYNRILKRRADRARLEAQGKIPKERRRYLHESRHRHAMNRVRGEGGRFHGANGKDDGVEDSGVSDNTPEGQQCLNEYFSQLPNKFMDDIAVGEGQT